MTYLSVPESSKLYYELWDPLLTYNANNLASIQHRIDNVMRICDGTREHVLQARAFIMMPHCPPTSPLNESKSLVRQSYA